MYNFDFEENEKWKKTLDLTHAVWRVADLCVDNDILKNKIKELSSEILSGYTVYVSECDDAMEKKILKETDSLIALLSLAQKTNYIKEINFLILKNEYKKIKFYLRAGMESRELGKNSKQSVTATDIQWQEEAPKKSVINRDVIKTVKEKTADENKVKPIINQSAKNASEKIPANNLNDRQEVLLKLFQNKKDSQVRLKDIMQSFPNFTDRTIRNDLRLLCESGVLGRSDGRGQGSFYYLIRK